MKDAEPSVIREMLKLSLDPDYISFAGGDPDPSFFPVEQLLSFDQRIGNDERILFQYSISEGNELLREQIVKYLKTIDIKANLENIIITTGGQQGLDLTGKVFIEEDDAIAVEGPTYMGAINAFRQYLPSFDSVEMDEEGISVNKLNENFEGGRDYKFIYVIPDFQNPTGKSMSYRRRKELLEFAEKYDLLIIEDSPYYSLRFQGEQLPAIKSMDENDNVIYIGSFSKMICPANRIGWVCASDEIIEKYVIAKQAADIHSNELSQLQTANYLKNYSLKDHMKLINSKYKEKKDTMINAIRKYFPECVEYTEPEGGLFVWLTLPKEWVGEDIMKQCLHEKVTIVPGSRFYANDSKLNNIRLSFATMDVDMIEEGIRRMGKLLRSY